LIFIFVQGKTDLFVPLRVLTTTLYRLSSSLLAIERDKTVWVLLSDMPLVGKVFLEMMVSVENG
jgi:hypothetical protein